MKLPVSYLAITLSMVCSTAQQLRALSSRVASDNYLRDERVNTLHKQSVEGTGRNLLGSNSATLSGHEILGFYGAANDGGTFVRTLADIGVTVGDHVMVTGTDLYDGAWEVLAAFPYQDPQDPQMLFGYQIAQPFVGFPEGYSVNGETPNPITASVVQTHEILGFFGAENDGGTFVRTLENIGVTAGDHIMVTGTDLYDGSWKVLAAFPYGGPLDPQVLFGYQIETTFVGFPEGYSVNRETPNPVTAFVVPILG